MARLLLGAHPGTIPSPKHWSAVLGVTCNVLSAFFGALSKSCLKLAHNLEQTKDDPSARERMPKGSWACLCLKYSNPWFAFASGIVVAPLEVCLDLLGYFWAPQRLVSPLSGLVVAWNLVIAEAFLGEKPTWHDRVATGTILVGAAMVGTSIPKSNPKYAFDQIFDHFRRPQYFVYAAICLLLFIFFTLVLSVKLPEKYKRMRSMQSKLSPFAYACLAGLIGGQQYFIKIATELFHPWCNTPWFTSLWPWIFCALAIAVAFFGLYVLNEGLRHYEILLLMPTFQATMIASGTAAAAAFWGDADGLPAGIFVLYTAGVTIAFGGVLVLMLKVEEPEASATVGIEVESDAQEEYGLVDKEDDEFDHEGAEDVADEKGDVSPSHAPLPGGEPGKDERECLL